KDDKLQILPKLLDGEKLNLISVTPNQHFTQPPARYSEASLVKKLESEGIGRPSTYAPTISTLITRGYVVSEERKLVPQQIGKIVCELLEDNFEFVVDPEFTAEMEAKLDNIADGKQQWQPVVKEFYDPLEKLIKAKSEDIKKVEIPVIETDEICEKCGRKMVIKSGRYGQFLACKGFPECKNTKPIIKSLNITCPECRKGEIIEKKTKKGRVFYGCSRYPECKYASWTKPDISKNK
ncbi:MAG: DNA topoisomerase, partial [bacterium]|nr:DNA topoisomerase [bacterium]